MTHPLPVFPSSAGQLPEGETYRRWSHGWCPCCAGDICEWIDGTQPQAIGEGVMICGRCIANDHLRPGGLAAAMLEAIAFRSDAPIDALMEML